MDASSNNIASCRRSKAIVGGLVVVDGTTFLVVKRCPLCLLTNTDPNTIPGGGPYSMETMALTPWTRGPSENPIGRFCKPCPWTYELGGFEDENDEVDQIIEETQGGSEAAEGVGGGARGDEDNHQR